MGKLVLWIIVFLMLVVVPIIPYEHEMQDGVTAIDNKTVVEYLYEQYQQAQESKHVDPNEGDRPQGGSQ